MSSLRTQLATVLLAALLPLLGACASGTDSDSSMKPARIEKLPFGTVDGRAVDQYVLANAHGVTVKIMTRGATITSINVPDRQGNLDDIVLGFDDLKGYSPTVPYFGAIVGRVGNRIAKGRFTLDGKTYQLAINNGPNHLHGGNKGFDKVIWDAEEVPAQNGSAVKFSYLSKDGEEGYPGNCRVEVTYTLGDDDSLRLDYFVTTDADTPVNVTNHSYFNLDGPENGNILDELVMINADRYTPVDSTLIPTGELAPVEGTPMDFRQPTAIGARVLEVGDNPKGYDHNYVVNGGGGKLTLVARVIGPKSGRIMEEYSTEPGVQFYSGNFLDGTLVGKKGVAYKQYWGFCLETQHFPDSVNQPNFPSYVLKAGDTYRSTTVFKFSAK
jgi:aldose 1-epimerase